MRPLNGDPTFNLDEQEEWFRRIAKPFKEFVATSVIDPGKYLRGESEMSVSLCDQ